MLKWFLSLFKKVDIVPNKPFEEIALPAPRHPGFIIEDYPHTQRYYPKYHDWYIGRNPESGKLILLEPYLFEHAIFTCTETEADELIIQFKHDTLKTQKV